MKPAISSPSATVPAISTGPPSQTWSSRGITKRAERVQPVDVEVVRAAVALGVGLVVGVDVDRDAEARRGAAVVGVGVAEHDAREPAELGAGEAIELVIALMPASNSEHAVAVADEVDVHRLQREAAAQQPDAVGDRLELAAEPLARPSSWR